MASISEKEKKELMERVSKRVEREVKDFNVKVNEYLQGKIEIRVLDNMVSQYNKALLDDYSSLIGYMDEELTQFFEEKITSLNIMEKIVYDLEPKLFNNKIKKSCESIIKIYDLCLSKLNNNKSISKQIGDLNDLITNLKTFINKIIQDDEKFLNDERYNDIIVRALSVIEQVQNDMKDLRKQNDKLDESLIKRKNKVNNKTDANVDEIFLLGKYISRLSKGRKVILQFYPGMDKFVDGTIKYLNDLYSNKDNISKEEIRKTLNNVKKSLLEQVSFDIDKNTIKRKKDNTKNNNSDNRELNNAYSSLLAAINNYIRDFEDKKNIISKNMLSKGNSDEKLERIVLYTDGLYELVEQIRNKSRSVADIRRDFYKIKDNIKSDLGYGFKEEKKRRRRKAISVKRSVLGLAGISVGAYGVITLVQEIAFLAKWGLAFSGPVGFLISGSMMTISAILMKKAISPKEKIIVEKVMERIKNNQKQYNDLLEEENNSKRR